MYVGINKGKVYRVSQKHVKGAIHCTIALWYFNHCRLSQKQASVQETLFVVASLSICSDRRQGRSVGCRRKILKESTGRVEHIKLNLSFRIKMPQNRYKKVHPT